MELEDIRNAVEDGLAQIAIQRLADRRITARTFDLASKWVDAITEEATWVACLYEAEQIAALNRRELAEMVRDGLSDLRLHEWLDEKAEFLSHEENSTDAITNLLSELRTL